MAKRFLATRSDTTRREYSWRLARFAHYMGLTASRWSDAISRLSRLPEREGRGLFLAFLPWLRSRRKVHQSMNRYRSSITTFMSYLRREGVISWEVRSQEQENAHRRWLKCPKAFREWILEWFSVLGSSGISARAIRGYRFILVPLGMFLAKRRCTLATLTHREIVQWIEEMNESRLSPFTINHSLTIARKWCRWLHFVDRIDRNPFETMEPLRLTRRLPAILDSASVVHLITSTKSLRDRAVLELLYGTGCRSRELETLDLDDISLKRRLVTYRGVGGETRTLPYNVSSHAALRRYLKKPIRRGAETRAFFINREGGRLGVAGIRALVTKAARRAGIHKPVNPRILRNSFAAHFLDRGGKEATLRYFLGHRTFTATASYASVAIEAMKCHYDRFHPRR